MITQRTNKCIPQKLKINEIPDYICLPDGVKHYLSKEEKKDYEFGGKCPKICPIKNVPNNSCPKVDYVSDTTVARNMCQADPNCHFIGNQVFDRNGPNYCVPKQMDGCITLTEADLSQSDKFLTDSDQFCDRLNKGCIFNRGNADPNFSRNGEPVCLRGCLGSKYYKNPKYIWGGGGTLSDPFQGSYFNSDLEVIPKYLEQAPSKKNPRGWGGPIGKPWEGHGLLPKSLGVPYTLSRGEYSPPCNLNEGDIGAFTTSTTGEDLAGPGCMLTAPRPDRGIQDWSYTCSCPYGGDTTSDSYTPCKTFELDQEKINKRDVCKGCYILDDKSSPLNGFCVLGETTPDTESKLLGCFDDPKDPDKCRVKRTIHPTECPSFCSNNKLNRQSTWKSSTQCAKQLSNQCWKFNPNYNKVISLYKRDQDNIEPPYVKSFNNHKQVCKPKNTDYLCEDCAPTTIRTIGTGTVYPNRARCIVGGNISSISLDDATYQDDLLRKLSCPATCSSCHTGVFGEPLESHYKFNESANSSSVFSKGIVYTPFVGTQAVKELQVERKNFKS